MAWTWILVLLSVATMTGGQLLLKKGLLVIGQYPGDLSSLLGYFWKAFTNVYVVSALLLVVVSALSWILALSKSQLSYIYPLAALSYVFVAIFSVLLLKEDMTVLRGVGIAVICLGIFLVSRT
jgi:uncharacterized membrane protein